MMLPTQKELDDAANAIVTEFLTRCIPPSLEPKMSPKKFQYNWKHLRPIIQEVIIQNKHKTDTIIFAIPSAKLCILRDFAEYLI